MVDLLSCPFCGAPETADPQHDGVGLYESGSQDQWPTEYRIWCEPCGAEMSGADRELVITNWNTRALEAAGTKALVEALDKLVEAVRFDVDKVRRLERAEDLVAQHRSQS